MAEGAARFRRGARTGPGGVVVGVDGSLGVLAAVSWAAAEAARRGLPLHLVEVHPAAVGITEAHRSSNLRRARAVASVVASGVAISVASLVGAVGPALRARARDAELLVIGARRHTDPSTEPDGATRFLLARAACATAVVPARWAGSWASTPSPRPVVVGLTDTPDDDVVHAFAHRIARRLGVELISVRPRRPDAHDEERDGETADTGAALTEALLDVGPCAQLIVTKRRTPTADHVPTRRLAELEGLLRRCPCAVVVPPSPRKAGVVPTLADPTTTRRRNSTCHRPVMPG